ncbi:MAG: tetratricopeptide repeat protein [bacterium]|nr:tetratricopeptide repeat protein [bacterium]
MKKVLTILLIIVAAFLLNGCGKKNVNSNYRGRVKQGSPQHLVNEAFIYLNNGELAVAEKKFKKALKKKFDMVGAINGMGIIYLQRREFDKAARNFRRVVQLNPKLIDAYNYLGVIFSEKGQYELAKENLLIAANSESYRTPENAFVNLALLELKYKKYKAAERYAQKGLAENKNFAPLYNIKGIISENLKHYRKAIFYYEKAQSLLTKDDIGYLVNTGRVYAKMGRKNKALDILERAMALAHSPDMKAQIQKMLKDLQK